LTDSSCYSRRIGWKRRSLKIGWSCYYSRIGWKRRSLKTGWRRSCSDCYSRRN
jgi:hypothetical protein